MAPRAGLVGVDHLDLPPPLLGIARVHPEEVVGEESSLIPSRPGPHLHDHVLVVVGVLGKQRQAQLVLELALARFERLHLLPGEGGHLGIGGVPRHASHVDELVDDAAVLPAHRHQVLERGILLRNLLEAEMVRRHLGSAHQPAPAPRSGLLSRRVYRASLVTRSSAAKGRREVVRGHLSLLAAVHVPEHDNSAFDLVVSENHGMRSHLRRGVPHLTA